MLDENLPKRLKLDFSEHEIYTVREKNWEGKKNGELMSLLIENSFDALLTFDKNLQHQQNFQKHSITVFVLSAVINSYDELTKLSPLVKEFLTQENLPLGAVVIK